MAAGLSGPGGSRTGSLSVEGPQQNQINNINNNNGQSEEHLPPHDDESSLLTLARRSTRKRSLRYPMTFGNIIYLITFLLTNFLLS